MTKPVGKGRKRIEMKKIQNKCSLGVTFSKRRNGLFKKANELVTLCGAVLALVVFSPGNKAYSFGNPNVYVVLKRFMQEFFNDHSKDSTFGGKYFEMYKESSIDVGNLYTQCNEIQKHAEDERSRAKEHKKQINQGYIMEMPPTEQLSLPEASELRAMVQELKGRISSEINKRFVTESCMMNIGDSSNKFIGEGQVDLMFNFFDAPGTSDIPGPSNYGPWDI